MTSDELVKRRSAREKARDERMLADLRDFRRRVRKAALEQGL